jgi:hypothetical protein
MSEQIGKSINRGAIWYWFDLNKTRVIPTGAKRSGENEVSLPALLSANAGNPANRPGALPQSELCHHQ